MKQPEYNILWILFQGILHCIGWNDFVQFHSRLYGSGTGISSENEVVKFWQSIFLYEFFGNWNVLIDCNMVMEAEHEKITEDGGLCFNPAQKA